MSVIDFDWIVNCIQCRTLVLRKLMKKLNRSDKYQYYWVCPICKIHINHTKGYWIDHDFIRYNNLEAAAMDDKTIPEEKCMKCKKQGAEYHHYAPKAIFEDADLWGGVYLCREHHMEWHRRIEAYYKEVK